MSDKPLRLLQLPFISDQQGRQFIILEYVYTCYGVCIIVYLLCSHQLSHFDVCWKLQHTSKQEHTTNVVIQ